MGRPNETIGDVDLVINELAKDLEQLDLDWSAMSVLEREGLVHHHPKFDFPSPIDVRWNCTVWQQEECVPMKDRRWDMAPADYFAYIVIRPPHWREKDL